MPQDVYRFNGNLSVPHHSSMVLAQDYLDETAYANYGNKYHQSCVFNEHRASYWENSTNSHPWVQNAIPNHWNNSLSFIPSTTSQMVQMQNCANFHTELAPTVTSPDNGCSITSLDCASSDPNPAAMPKCKRVRTAFTTDQTQLLERHFQKRPYISRDERIVLNQKLHVGDRAIKVWFQNRRLKEKRIQKERLDSPQKTLEADSNFQSCYEHSSQTSCYNSGLNLKDSDFPIGYLIPDIENKITNSDVNTQVASNGSVDLIDSEYIRIYEPVSPPDFNEKPVESDQPFLPLDPETCLQILLCSNC